MLKLNDLLQESFQDHLFFHGPCFPALRSSRRAWKHTRQPWASKVKTTRFSIKGQMTALPHHVQVAQIVCQHRSELIHQGSLNSCLRDSCIQNTAPAEALGRCKVAQSYALPCSTPGRIPACQNRARSQPGLQILAVKNAPTSGRAGMLQKVAEKQPP